MQNFRFLAQNIVELFLQFPIGRIMSQNVLGSCDSAGLRLTLTVAEMRPSGFFIDSYTVKINENVPSVTQTIRSQHLKYKQSRVVMAQPYGQLGYFAIQLCAVAIQ